MNGIFDWLLDAPYEDRKVDKYEKGDLFISTVEVSDGNKPFETAVAHPKYNSGKIVIVEAYGTREQAIKGHKAWTERMTTKPLPIKLTDCLNAKIALFTEMLYTKRKDIN